MTVPNIHFYAESTDACQYITSLDEVYISYGGEILSQSVDGTLRCDDHSLVDILVAYSPY